MRDVDWGKSSSRRWTFFRSSISPPSSFFSMFLMLGNCLNVHSHTHMCVERRRRSRLTASQKINVLRLTNYCCCNVDDDDDAHTLVHNVWWKKLHASNFFLFFLSRVAFLCDYERRPNQFFFSLLLVFNLLVSWLLFSSSLGKKKERVAKHSTCEADWCWNHNDSVVNTY